MDFKIPFSGRSHKYMSNEIDAVVHAMKDADPLTQGKYRDKFETVDKNGKLDTNKLRFAVFIELCFRISDRFIQGDLVWFYNYVN